MPRIQNVDALFANIDSRAKASTKKVERDTLGKAKKLVGSNLEKIEVGKGVQLSVPKEVKGKNFLAQVRGALMAVGRKGEPLAGRKYLSRLHVAEDGVETVVTKRIADGEPGTVGTGGRPKGSKNKPKEAPAPAEPATTSAEGNEPAKTAGEAKERAKAHLGGDKANDNNKKVKDLTAA